VIAIIALGPLELAIAAVLVLLGAAVSLALRLGVERRLTTAAVRAVVQLTLLGLVLEWIFAAESPLVVAAMMTFMALVAGLEAVRRTTHRVRGMLPRSMAVMLGSSALVTFYGLIAVIRVERWWEPQYAIPILGMVLGNMLNGISLGLEASLEGFARERDRIELLLAHGATRREASRDVVRRAMRLGSIPAINMMVAAGLVSIPGMMTGQILSGESPGAAARYQIFILFCIVGGVVLGTFGIVVASSRLVFDERDRLRVERIQVRDK
jgi:putative ABC transport system permease protein